MSRWDPFAEIACRPGAGPWFTPAVDILEESDAVLVRMELAGVQPEDVRIEATPRLLTIRGERERPYEQFSRSFELPETVEGAAAVAIMNEGVLTVRIPKRCVRPSSDTFAA